MGGVLSIVGKEVLRGRFSVLGEFLAVGKHTGAVATELKEWQARVPAKVTATQGPTTSGRQTFPFVAGARGAAGLAKPAPGPTPRGRSATRR